jgi:hypothetical protein
MNSAYPHINDLAKEAQPLANGILSRTRMSASRRKSSASLRARRFPINPGVSGKRAGRIDRTTPRRTGRGKSSGCRGLGRVRCPGACERRMG